MHVRGLVLATCESKVIILFAFFHIALLHADVSSTALSGTLSDFHHLFILIVIYPHISQYKHSASTAEVVCMQLKICARLLHHCLHQATTSPHSGFHFPHKQIGYFHQTAKLSALMHGELETFNRLSGKV